jgi:NADH-quinone oxidoreductase subunit L
MLELLWLIPTLPLVGFLILLLVGSRLTRTEVTYVGCGSIGFAAIVMLIVGVTFISSPPPNHAYTQTLWTWVDVGGFSPAVALYLDALSLVMIFVVTFVGFLIHLYSAEYMEEEEEGYSRFFSYMNLFVASMLILLLADNLMLLLLGWEGVGLCSYLLIGFFYKESANGAAATKAFIVTRVGDTAMLIGLFLLFANLGTLDIQELLERASGQFAPGSGIAVAVALLLLGGAVGKSAQLPLQTWLPDAMAGPTPVSALIHAATMVTAGVYLIARTHVLFILAPSVQLLVAIVGTLTLLMAGFAALTQTDIKRVLAYSTISQIGYMFLALGVGAWSAALFHFMIHAFFKALLFLGAGAIIVSLHHQQDMFHMGGLRRLMPLTFWCFLIGSGALAAVPLITAGFYSKDLIIWDSWVSDIGGFWLWAGALFGAFLTSIYTFRMVFLTFYRDATEYVRHLMPIHQPGIRMQMPLVVLAVLSVGAGFIELPPTMGHLTLFSNFLHTALPPLQAAHASWGMELSFQLIAATVSLGGI